MMYRLLQIHYTQTGPNTLQTGWFKDITCNHTKIHYIILYWLQKVVNTLQKILLAVMPAQNTRQKSSNSHYKLKNVHSARVFDTTN